jgi:hypothetical protein
MSVFVVSPESSKKLVTQPVIILNSEILQTGSSIFSSHLYIPWGHPLFIVYLTQLLSTTSAYGNSWFPRRSGMCKICVGDTKSALFMDHISVRSVVILARFEHTECQIIVYLMSHIQYFDFCIGYKPFTLCKILLLPIRAVCYRMICQKG